MAHWIFDCDDERIIIVSPRSKWAREVADDYWAGTEHAITLTGSIPRGILKRLDNESIKKIYKVCEIIE